MPLCVVGCFTAATFLPFGWWSQYNTPILPPFEVPWNCGNGYIFRKHKWVSSTSSHAWPKPPDHEQFLFSPPLIGILLALTLVCSFRETATSMELIIQWHISGSGTPSPTAPWTPWIGLPTTLGKCTQQSLECVFTSVHVCVCFSARIG